MDYPGQENLTRAKAPEIVKDLVDVLFQHLLNEGPSIEGRYLTTTLAFHPACTDECHRAAEAIRLVKGLDAEVYEQPYPDASDLTYVTLIQVRVL